jgi:hypothetical protein
LRIKNFVIEIWENKPQKQGKSGKNEKKRANWKENWKLATALIFIKGKG